jgi:type II secretory pathway pseudopilin PulG
VFSEKEKVRELRSVRSRWPGFSLLEVLMVLLIAMVLLAIGLPAFLRMYHTIQLSDAANRVGDILRLTRYEAIRQNKSIECIIRPSGANPGMTVMWVDSVMDRTTGLPNGIQDPTEQMILLGNAGNLIDAGVPNSSGLIAKAVGTVGTTTPSPAAGGVWFDARGAVKPPTNVNVFYLASPAAPEAGFRAVLLMPTGSLQIWSADTSGNWTVLR